jgi:hypothetical protein
VRQQQQQQQQQQDVKPEPSGAESNGIRVSLILDYESTITGEFES